MWARATILVLLAYGVDVRAAGVSPSERKFSGKNVFSPSGRLLQTEYVSAVVSRGPAVLGAVCGPLGHESICLACLRPLPSTPHSGDAPSESEESLLAVSSRLYRVASHAAVACAGIPADGRAIAKKAEQLCAEHLRTYGVAMPGHRLAAALAAHVHDASLAWGRRSYACSVLVATLVEDSSNTSEDHDRHGSTRALENSGGVNNGPTDGEGRVLEAEVDSNSSSSLGGNCIGRASTTEQISPRAQLHVVTSEGTHYRCTRAYALGGGDSKNKDEESSDVGNSDNDEEESKGEGSPNNVERGSSQIDENGSNIESLNHALNTLSLSGGEAALQIALGKIKWELHDETSGGAALRALLLAASQSSQKYGQSNPIGGNGASNNASDETQGGASEVPGTIPRPTVVTADALPTDGKMGLDEGVLQWDTSPFANKGGQGAKWTQHSRRC